MTDKIDIKQCKDFLEMKVLHYNNPSFIPSDPIQIPHGYSKKEDIEIAAFLTASIAWGQRSTIINNGRRLMNIMSCEPYNFIINHSEEDLDSFLGFVHRTFNGFDCVYFIKTLQRIYKEKGGLEQVFMDGYTRENRIYDALKNFRQEFFKHVDPGRTAKHISDVTSNSAAKRLNMFLRWMVRKSGGVDFGIWKNIDSSDLMIPLDLHSGNTARKLGILKRKQNDWKAVEELNRVLKTFDPSDPVKYDYALFGLGVFEKF